MVPEMEPWTSQARPGLHQVSYNPIPVSSALCCFGLGTGHMAMFTLC